MSSDTPQATFPPPGDKAALEEGTTFTPKFDANGLIPCIAQDAANGDILMFAFMNAEALQKTLETGKAHYYSRSRGKLWLKGESSGHVQHVEEVKTDCDQDVVLIRVRTDTASCHTGYRSCFYRKVARLGGDHGNELTFTEKEKAFDPKQVYKS